MPTINDVKELETPGTPLFLFDCTLSSGDIQRWSTHNVSVNGQSYSARVLQHNAFDLTSSPEAATDGLSKISVTLANADGILSEVERNAGWKGSQLGVTFLFFDLKAGVPASDTQVVFRGVANPPDQVTDATVRLSFTNRLNLQRVYLPDVTIQKRCPWMFPSTSAQRQEAVAGGSKGQFSRFYRCGYSADQPGGAGTLNGSVPYTACDYSRLQCQQRGMFNLDANQLVTRRFGGIEFMPPAIQVRSYGEKGSHLAIPLPNQALYNDVVPLVYGTGWYEPPIVFARNDGNLTHLEVLLGAGELTSVLKVIVNDFDIPVGVSGANMTATGWYSIVTLGTRSGNFNLDFCDSAGNSLGDPYGSMGVISVVVPNGMSSGTSLPAIKVLVQGLKLARFDSNGNPLDTSFTNNPAWVMLDVLLRSGWTTDLLDLPSFATVAQSCDALVHTTDLHGNDTLIPRYQCNLMLTGRRSAGDIVRGIRNGSALYLSFDSTGRLQLNGEDTLAVQQPAKRAGSNSSEPLNGGWPAYEFGDSFSGIVRRSSGQASLTISSRATSDTPNRYTAEFQDEFNEYQQDSLSLVDVDDCVLNGQDITVTLTALGLPNFDQATRAAGLQLYKSVRGNTYIEFETSVKGAGLRPGDLIALTYAREGFNRNPFRITKVSPSVNFMTARITAQMHDDSWYSVASPGSAGAGRQPGFDSRLPRPLVGSVVDANGVAQFGITQSAVTASDGGIDIELTVGFSAPRSPTASSAGIPLVGLNAQVGSSGGTLMGGQTLYYAISATDATGAEGALSFTVPASIPAGGNTNQVALTGLSFSAGATAFDVYRGANPAQLLRIASGVALASQFTDTGLSTSLIGPPDPNYDHANFYWRLELQPGETVDLHSANTIGNSTLNMLPNEYAGATVRIAAGTGMGQERIIGANTNTTVTTLVKWDIEPDVTSTFMIADSSWHFGATSVASPVSFSVPNREGVTIQVSGRAANVLDQESLYELCPITDWRVSGAAGSNLDTDVSGTPMFGLSAPGQGTVEIGGIGFTSLENTRTITAGTLTLAYWDELSGSSSVELSLAVAANDVRLTLGTAVSAQSGDLVQIESEILMVSGDVNNGTVVPVTRGAEGTTAAAHNPLTPVYFLAKKTYVLPFARDFIGSPASGSYAYPIVIPDVRIAAAELFMTNSQGNSDVARESFTSTSNFGLRTLSGGQLCIQVEGPLAIQTSAAPPLMVDSTHSVRDVYAVVGEPPTEAAVSLQVTQNGQPYCQLTIPINATMSNVVDGAGLGPLHAQAEINVDITGVTQAAGTAPGSDLTVTIRL
ncbi:MAG TPA: phage tail protein [Bryobacteraceae bacterium]|nr:phage tail protein [Bryobacteraceae bacterium]